MKAHDPEAAVDEPPTPGGDPDQPSSDVPNSPRKPAQPSEHRNKSGFGHIGNNDEPRPDGALPPHQIF